MHGFREFRVSPLAVKQARDIGMYGNVEGRLARMARASVPFSHPQANRRYHDYLLNVQGHTVVGVLRFDPSIPVSRKR